MKRRLLLLPALVCLSGGQAASADAAALPVAGGIADAELLADWRLTGVTDRVDIVAAGDVDDDGVGDIAASLHRAGAAARIVLGASTPADVNIASPGPRVWTITDSAGSGGVAVNAVAAGDVNGDGGGDVIATTYRNGTTARPFGYVLYGGPGRGGTTTDLASVTPAQGRALIGSAATLRLSNPVSAGDLDGDGFDDIAVNWLEGGEDFTARVTVIYGAAGTPSGVSLATPGAAGHLVKLGPGEEEQLLPARAGDVNGDDRDDLVFTRDGSTADGAWVLFGGPQRTTPLDLNDLGTAGFAIRAAGATPAGTIASRWGDLNGDGKDDLLFGSQYGTTIVDGRATTTPVVVPGAAGSHPFPDAPESATYAGDVNGDGAPDLAVTGGIRTWSAPPAGAPQPVARPPFGSVVFGHGSGTPFVGRQPVFSATPPALQLQSEMDSFEALPIGDVNGDGRDDLALRSALNRPPAIVLGYAPAATPVDTTTPVLSSVTTTTGRWSVRQCAISAFRRVDRPDMLVTASELSVIKLARTGPLGAAGNFSYLIPRGSSRFNLTLPSPPIPGRYTYRVQPFDGAGNAGAITSVNVALSISASLSYC
ncbi:MAG: VCBS repeat-containing protein [Solirubrobacteraceae bacterium]|nr:VCBS repeat-containing protein [Solirubrobacteraceae bacterium]